MLISFLASYSKMSLDTFSLLKMIMHNATIRQIGDWPPYMVSYLEESSLGRLMGSEILIREASHSFTKYLKEVEGADWGFIVTPRGEYSSISFRSMSNAPNVRLICEKMGIGGGHDRASGAHLETNDVHKAILIIEKWLSENKPTY
jgi:c-di-AMP phosphodiesterase-like protein